MAPTNRMRACNVHWTCCGRIPRNFQFLGDDDAGRSIDAGSRVVVRRSSGARCRHATDSRSNLFLSRGKEVCIASIWPLCSPRCSICSARTRTATGDDAEVSPRALPRFGRKRPLHQREIRSSAGARARVSICARTAHRIARHARRQSSDALIRLFGVTTTRFGLRSRRSAAGSFRAGPTRL